MMASIGTRKTIYSQQVKLESYVLTIHPKKEDCDSQSPTALWV